jgi:hypothetical protein
MKMTYQYYGIYQAERGKTAAELRRADAQIGELASGLGRFTSMLAGPSRAIRRSLRRSRSAVYPATPEGCAD